MNTTNTFTRPPKELIEPFWDLGTAGISSTLREVCGIRRAFITGPVSFTPGQKAVGVAVTLSFLPKREDQAETMEQENEEAQENTSAL